MTTRKKKERIRADSLLGLFIQLDHALANQAPAQLQEGEVPICPRCNARPRIYSNGRLYSYCGVCRKEVNRRHYERVSSHGKL